MPRKTKQALVEHRTQTLQTLVLGTRNLKKSEELAVLLAPLGVPLLSLADFPDAPQAEEVGSSFAENAHLKATQLATALGHWVLGEDSGLVVPALNGQPGIFSARYAGPNPSDEDNNRKLLKELESAPFPQRGAYYVCAIAVSDPAGAIRAEAEGRCHGLIATEPRGTSGFGYDPLFLLREYHKTFGELGPRVKRYLSHRARAVGQILPQLLVLKESG